MYRRPLMDQPREVTRLEGFSDAVFGFAITLLVVSLEVPATFDELLAVFRGLPVFAVCFAMLLLVWHEHHEYFRKVGSAGRRHGVAERRAALRGDDLHLPAEVPVRAARRAGRHATRRSRDQRMIRYDQLPTLMVIYGLGFVTIFLLLAAMYYRGWRKRVAAAGRDDAGARELA